MRLICTFFTLYMIGNLSNFRPLKPLPGLLLSTLGKILLLAYLLRWPPEVFALNIYALNIFAILAISFALKSCEYHTFLRRTDFVQSVILVNLSASKMLQNSLQSALLTVFLPYLLASATLLLLGTYLERLQMNQDNRHSGLFLENFNHLFWSSPWIGTLSIAAMTFFAEVMPLQGLLSLKYVPGNVHAACIALFVLSICSLGYVYLKLELAILRRKENPSV